MNNPKFEKHIAKAIVMLADAQPNPGPLPKTEAEWTRILAAYEEFGYATYRSQGASDKDARALAKTTHSGDAGRLMLNLAMKGGK